MDKKKIKKYEYWDLAPDDRFCGNDIAGLKEKVNEIIDHLNNEEERKREEGCTCDPLYHYVCPMHARRQLLHKLSLGLPTITEAQEALRVYEMFEQWQAVSIGDGKGVTFEQFLYKVLNCEINKSKQNNHI